MRIDTYIRVSLGNVREGVNVFYFITISSFFKGGKKSRIGGSAGSATNTATQVG